MAIVREYVREDPHYHEHHHGSTSLVWAIVLIVVLALLFTYGLPLLRSGFRAGGTQINIPDRLNVNINQPAAPQGGGPGVQAPQKPY